MQELCNLLIRFKCFEEFYEHCGKKYNIIIPLLIKLGLTHQVVDIVKVLNVRYNWVWIIKMTGWNSVKCDILSDPMHVRVAMIAKNYVGQISEIKVAEDNPQLLARINFCLNYSGQIWTKIIHNAAEAFPLLCYSRFVQPFKGL